VNTDKIYRHYGSNKFDPGKCNIELEPVICRYLKPRGGLWASPIGDEYFTWKEWCEGEEFHLERLREYFDFKLKPDSRVMTITSLEDCEQLLPYLYSDSRMILPFNGNGELVNMINMDKLLNDYDAIELIHSDNYNILHLGWNPEDIPIPSTLKMFAGSFYSWDVDSIVINNPDIVIELSCSIK